MGMVVVLCIRMFDVLGTSGRYRAPDRGTEAAGGLIGGRMPGMTPAVLSRSTGTGLLEPIPERPAHRIDHESPLLLGRPRVDETAQRRAHNVEQQHAAYQDKTGQQGQPPRTRREIPH